MSKQNYKLAIRMLPDEHGNPSERVRICWFRVCDGPITTGQAKLKTSRGTMTGPVQGSVWSGVRGMIACQPTLASINPYQRGEFTVVPQWSPELTAVTCPECLATPEAKAELKRLALQAPAG